MADRDPLTATTLTELMRRRAAVSPDTPYFHLYGETVTYGRLWAQSGRYAAGLAAHGVKPGDKLCLIYPTCAEFFYTFFGAVRLGAVPVPMYPTLGVDATANVFRNSDAVAVATIGWFAERARRARAAGPRRRRNAAGARDPRPGGPRVPPVHVRQHGGAAGRDAHA